MCIYRQPKLSGFIREMYGKFQRISKLGFNPFEPEPVA